MPVKGIKNVNKNIRKFTSETATIKTQRVIHKIMAVGMHYASAITPINTSNLINSQCRELVPIPKGWIGRAGFTANYSEWVNNASGKLKGKKRTGKDSQGNYWSPNAEPHFVEKGFERDGKEPIKQIIKEGYKI